MRRSVDQGNDCHHRGYQAETRGGQRSESCSKNWQDDVFYPLIEVITCQDGCVGGAGQPYGTKSTKEKRGDVQARQMQSHHSVHDG